MLQWREMGGNQDRLEHISYPTILIVFFLLSSLDSEVVYEMFYRWVPLCIQNANCSARWPHIWIIYRKE